MLPYDSSGGGRRHTVIVSDVHLSQSHPDDPADPLWMRYRRREFHPDTDFARLVDHLLARHGQDSIEVVFNGDVLDFDAPWVKDGTSSFEEFPLTDAGCAEHARRLIADHPIWFRAVARLLNGGHRLLLLSGNHDVELYWPGVRRAICEELVTSASRATSATSIASTPAATATSSARGLSAQCRPPPKSGATATGKTGTPKPAPWPTRRRARA